MTLCDVVDELHDEHGLTHTSTAEETNLTTFQVRLEQVDHLDTRSKDFLLRRELLEGRCLTVNGIGVLHVKRVHTIDGLTDNVEHTTLNLIARRHQNRRSHRNSLKTTMQAVGIIHSHATHGVLADVLLHFDDQHAPVTTVNLQGIMNLRQYFLSILAGGIEIHVDNRTNDL